MVSPILRRGIRALVLAMDSKSCSCRCCISNICALGKQLTAASWRGGFDKWVYPKIGGISWKILVTLQIIWVYPYFRKPPHEGPTWKLHKKKRMRVFPWICPISVGIAWLKGFWKEYLQETTGRNEDRMSNFTATKPGSQAWLLDWIKSHEIKTKMSTWLSNCMAAWPSMANQLWNQPWK
jgi:hypothetical protein